MDYKSFKHKCFKRAHLHLRTQEHSQLHTFPTPYLHLCALQAIQPFPLTGWLHLHANEGRGWVIYVIIIAKRKGWVPTLVIRNLFSPHTSVSAHLSSTLNPFSSFPTACFSNTYLAGLSSRPHHRRQPHLPVLVVHSCGPKSLRLLYQSSCKTHVEVTTLGQPIGSAYSCSKEPQSWRCIGTHTSPPYLTGSNAAVSCFM